MDGVHDMGGMHGFGPIPIEKDEPVFHEPWEGHVYALGTVVRGGLYPSLDTSRFYLEMLPPAEYLGLSYYERWLIRSQRRLIELGHVTDQEIEERMAFYRDHPEAPVARHADEEIMERARARFHRLSGSLHRPDGAPPRFKVGDAVLTRNIHPAGHTRLPRYARGKPGVIDRFHGCHDFADTVAHGLGPNPQALYSVAFEPRVLWGDDAEGRGLVYIDLYDSYLDPAPAAG